MSVPAPIVGRANVARRFGVSRSTLARWQADPEQRRRLQLDRVTFRLGGRIATTERLVAEFIEIVRRADPREYEKRCVEEEFAERR